MRQTKESNKRAPGRVVIYISVHLVSIYTLTFSDDLLVLALNLKVHKSSYCKCSLAWCQARTFLLFTIWTHPVQMREYPLQYASTDKNKKSHYKLSCTEHGRPNQSWRKQTVALTLKWPRGVPRDPRFVFRAFYYFRLRFFHRYFF